MLVLFTDFGFNGPYLGQMSAVLHRDAPGIPVINLFADAPVYDVLSCSHLLASYAAGFPQGTVFLAVVDPGVGSQRIPVVLETAGSWFVGPGNGLFDVLQARDPDSRLYAITWQPATLSASFHGRDLFAPVAAKLAMGKRPGLRLLPRDTARLVAHAGDLTSIIYIDHYGNLISGLRASSLEAETSVIVKGQPVPRVRTFADVNPGKPLCYENSSGLLEVAVNQGSAAAFFSAIIGDKLLTSGAP